MFETGRLLALSDGVYAISLTLLVLSLEIPDDVTAGGLGDALRDLRPQLFAYGLSVAVLGIFWLAHHRLFAAVERIDTTTLAVNLLYLALVAVLPFPTNVLGRFGDQRPAVVLYALAVGAASLADTALDVLVRRRAVLKPIERPADALGPVALPVGIVFLATVPVAWWNPDLARLLWLAAIPWSIAAERLALRQANRSGPAAPTGGAAGAR